MSNNKIKTNILVECQELLASVKVGVLEPLKPLVKKDNVDIRFKRTLDVVDADIAWCDILITVRAVEYATLKIVEKARSLNRYIIYFLDDDFLGLPSNLPGCEIFEDKKIKQNIVEILKLSNILWCVNDLIGKKYGVYTKKGYILSKVPVNVNFKEKEFTADKVKILYAGSESHTPLVEKYLKPLVIQLSQEFRDKVEITFIGATPKIDLKAFYNIRIIKSFENYEEYRGFVENENFDIGLAVLGNEDFYRYKYYNKFIEYSSIGCVGVYTDSEPYSLIIDNLKNGVLTLNTESDWYNSVKRLIEDGNLRREYLKNSINLLRNEFNYEKVAEELKNYIPELIEYRSPMVEAKNVKLPNLKIIFIRERFFYFFRKYKFKAIPIIFYKIIKKLNKKILSFSKKGVEIVNRIF